MRILHIDLRSLCSLVISIGIALPFIVSCSKENEAVSLDERKPIELSVATDRTKAIVDGSTLPETYTVYASAYFTSFTAPETNSDYFIAKPFRLSSGIWSSNPAVYWPIGGKLDILSIACEDSESDVHESAVWHEGNCSEGIEVTLQDGHCLKSEILFAAAYDRTVDGGSVPMRFKHAQSWLQFVINAETETIRVDSIVLENVYSGGLFRVSNNVYMDAEWSFRGHRKANMIVPGSEGIIPQIGTPSVCNILVPEQDACCMEIHYSIKNSDAEDWSDARNSIYRHPSGVNPWYYGEKNVYEITFGISQITLSSSIIPWDDIYHNISIN